MKTKRWRIANKKSSRDKSSSIDDSSNSSNSSSKSLDGTGQTQDSSESAKNTSVDCPIGPGNNNSDEIQEEQVGSSNGIPPALDEVFHVSTSSKP